MLNQLTIERELPETRGRVEKGSDFTGLKIEL